MPQVITFEASEEAFLTNFFKMIIEIYVSSEHSNFGCSSHNKAKLVHCEMSLIFKSEVAYEALIE